MGTSDVNHLTFQETDEADNPTATYIYSEQLADAASKRAIGRVDVMVSSIPLSSFLDERHQNRYVICFDAVP